MPAMSRQQRHEMWIAVPRVAPKGSSRNGRSVERVDHQRRHGNAIEKSPAGVAYIVVFRSRISVSQRGEIVVELPKAARGLDGTPFGHGQRSAGRQGVVTHVMQQMAVIDEIPPPP